MASIEFRELTKDFGGGAKAVDEFSLAIEDGEFVVLVGPSGSGKTTVLRMTAGLETPTSGEVRIGDEVVNDVDPQDRDIAMVFQSYALYPHMNVFDNMAFGLRLHGMKRKDLAARVEPAAEMLGLGDLLKRKPGQLSGGQRQRVAMGRAIVREPAAFLMDEPLSNLDAKLRVEMRSYVAMLHQRLRTTTVYVTHDQTEAMTMGDRVAVMRDGKLVQCDVPQALYMHPANLFVAGFIGSPAMNFVQSRLFAADGALSVAVGGSTLHLPPAVLAAHPHLGEYAGREVIVGIRPEDMEDATFVPSANGSCVDVQVSLAEPMGAEVIAHFSVAGASAGESTALAELREHGQLGAESILPLPGRGDAGMTARLSPNSRARAGARLRLAIELQRLHFFDPDTEASIW